MEKTLLQVGAMECPSCEKIISKQAKRVKGVKKIKVDYVSGTAEVTYDKDLTSLDEIINSINKEGYDCRLYNESEGKALHNPLVYVALTLGVLSVLAGAYVVLGDSLSFSIPTLDQNTSLALLFVVGLFTGFHCIAMCGGFVVSYSSKKALHQHGLNLGSHLSYAFGKTLSYTVIGALFGLIGSFFTFTPMMRGVAAVLAGLFLIVFGLNMLGMLKWFRRFRLKTPGFIEKTVSRGKDSHPLVIGLLNGLMIACGPLQAIYIFAAASGSMYYGALYLLAFGLGTLPVLLGFGLIASLVSSKLTHKILRFSGALVMVLGLIMLNRGLMLTGTGYDFNTFLASVSAESPVGSESASVIQLDSEGSQIIYMNVTRYGWTPDKFVLKKGVPVKWVIDGQEINGCNDAIQVPKLGLNFDVRQGVQTVEFTPTLEGVIPWSCWMGMIPGVFIVKEDIDVDNQAEVEKELESVQVSSGGSCGGSCGSPTCGAARGGSCGCGGRR